jgi:hypothetical protein
VPQPAVVPPPVPVQAAPPNEVVQAPVSAHVVKRSVTPSRSPAVRALPNSVPAPAVAASPETIPPVNTPLIAVPQGPTGALPASPATDPAQSLPDQPALPDQPVPPAPSPQPTPAQPPQ